MFGEIAAQLGAVGFISGAIFGAIFGSIGSEVIPINKKYDNYHKRKQKLEKYLIKYR